MDESDASLADVLKGYRAAAGLTQEELAERARLSARAISDLERGLKRRPHAYTIQRLIAGLGLQEEDAARLQHAARRLEGVADVPREQTKGGQGRVPLPLQPTPFIGRKRERDEVKRVLSRRAARLLTLTGPAGVGKTRLALRVAQDVAGSFPDGVVFVSLASLADPSRVSSAIASTFGMRESGDLPPLEVLANHLHARSLLLVLDNFEHLLAAGDAVAHLLMACPDLVLLVTSRTVLHLAAEHEYPVHPLAVPMPGHVPEWEALSRYDSIQLFVQRAEAVRPAFRLTDDNAAVVAEICSRLDGLPLAIELAAARIRVFPPRALLERLSPQLTLLTGGARDQPARLQTVRAAIDWSYHLLGPHEQTLFARLSVFAGGCSLEAADRVCNPDGDLGVDVLESLTALVEQSLVYESGEDEPRFAMLETIREYALERLEEGDELERLKRHHAEWYLSLAEEAALKLQVTHQSVWLERLEREHDNLRAVLNWLADRGEVESALRLAIALSRFWQIRGYLAEGLNWLIGLLASGEESAPSLQAQAMLRAGELTFAQGRDPESVALFERSLDLHGAIGDQHGRLEALGRLADALVNQGQEDREVALLLEHVRVGREQDDQILLASALYRLAKRAAWHDDTKQTKLLGEESLTLFRALGNVRGTVNALQVVATAAYREGELAQARVLSDEIVALLPRSDLSEEMRVLDELQLPWAARDRGDYGQARRLWSAFEARSLELGDVWSAAYARMFLATVVREQGEYDQARVLARDSLVVFQEAEDRRGAGRALVVLSDVARDQGEAQAVRDLCERALALFRDVGVAYQPATALHNLGLAAFYQGDCERAEALLSESLAYYRQNASAWRLAEALSSIGLVALGQGQLERARQAFSESLRTTRSWTLPTVLDGLASVAVKQGNAERAARLFGAAEVVRTTMGTPICPANQAIYRCHVSLARNALGSQAFATAWKEGEALTAEQAVSLALERPKVKPSRAN